MLYFRTMIDLQLPQVPVCVEVHTLLPFWARGVCVSLVQIFLSLPISKKYLFLTKWQPSVVKNASFISLTSFLNQLNGMMHFVFKTTAYGKS